MNISANSSLRQITNVFVRASLLYLGRKRFRTTKRINTHFAIELREPQVTIDGIEQAALKFSNSLRTMSACAALPMALGAESCFVRSDSGLGIRAVRDYHPEIGFIIRFDVAGSHSGSAVHGHSVCALL